MADVLKIVSTRSTPQSVPAGAATTKNAAGGFVFDVDDSVRLRRFLILGTEGGTYYTKAPELTRQNAEVVIRMAENDPQTLVDTVVEISTAGRAPRQNPAIFALAIAASLADTQGRAYALSKLNEVCRTATHLFLFAGYAEQFRGWGRHFKRAVANWYTAKSPDKLAYQLLKYRQREGWTHQSLLRLAHPDPITPERDRLFKYILANAQGKNERSPHFGHAPDFGALPGVVGAYENIQNCTVKQAVDLIEEHNLSWEMLPDRLHNEPDIWAALINKGIPQTALMRQLPRLTKLGLTTGENGKTIADQLKDAQRLKLARVHPINVLVAQRTYASGRSARGDGTWTPTRLITDALDSAFYNAYAAVEASRTAILLACDVSGSMGSPAGGLPISCREAVAALSLVTLNTEQDAEIIGFSDGRSHSVWGMGWRGRDSSCTRLDVSPRRRLDDVCTYMANLSFGATDCALPYIWAKQNKLDFSTIITLTDNETWFGQVHPWQALRDYREHVGHDVKSIVVAMTSTGYSIADPNDAGSLDIAGFDSNVPQIISDFSAGRI